MGCTPCPMFHCKWCMTRPVAQRDDPFSWGGGRPSAVPRGRCRRCGACCTPSPSGSQTQTLFYIYCRPTPRPAFDSEIHARHLFFLSGRAPCPAAECRVERASRMASPGGVDHGARTKCHGRRERPAASSGSFRFTFDSLAVWTDAAGRCRVLLGTREPRAHDGTSTGASEGRNKGHS